MVKHSSLLPLHSRYTDEELIRSCYEAHADLSNVTFQIVEFWSEAHQLSCIHQQRFSSKVGRVKDDFEIIYSDDTGEASMKSMSDLEGCRSLCVAEALTKALQEGRLLENRANIDKSQQVEYLAKVLRNRLSINEKLKRSSELSPSMVTVGISILRKLKFSFLASLDLSDDCDDSIQTLAILNDETDLINTDLLIDCCMIILESLEYFDQLGVDESLIMKSVLNTNKYFMQSNDVGNFSFRKLCIAIGKSVLIKDNAREGVGSLLSNISVTDSCLLLDVFNAARCATFSHDRRSFFLSRPLDMMNENKQKEESLNEIDFAIFRLSISLSLNQKRLLWLQLQASNAKLSALDAKRSGLHSTALLHMKRFKIMIDEAQNCAKIILKLETMQESIKRAACDHDIIQCMELSTNALRVIRRSEEEGGLGLSEERVLEVGSVLNEELFESDRVSKLLGDVDLLSGTMSSLVIDAELDEEYDQLQQELSGHLNSSELLKSISEIPIDKNEVLLKPSKKTPSKYEIIKDVSSSDTIHIANELGSFEAEKRVEQETEVSLLL